jgi:Zn-dependent peptidase ImmA (M78 family)
MQSPHTHENMPLREKNFRLGLDISKSFQEPRTILFSQSHNSSSMERSANIFAAQVITSDCDSTLL